MSLILRDAEMELNVRQRSTEAKMRNTLHEASTGLNRGLHHASRMTISVFRAIFGPLDVLKSTDSDFGHDGLQGVKVKKADLDRPRPHRTATRDWINRQLVSLLSKIR